MMYSCCAVKFESCNNLLFYIRIELVVILGSVSLNIKRKLLLLLLLLFMP